ncbi:hypothetical protein PIB30_012362 [Stylosanthes scabra]|uniref:Uncharacterized protein n=1 Tax=Stylosanthes scabra TaxID=79078 RepID=A0ABU6Z3N2_9FABA|nr:hypothetical protein [Stylosanthes scabra]
MAGGMLSGCIQLRRVTWMINSSVMKFSTSTPSSEEILKELPDHIRSAADVKRIVSVVKPDSKESENDNMDAVNRRTQELSEKFPTWVEVYIHERDM